MFLVLSAWLHQQPLALDASEATAVQASKDSKLDASASETCWKKETAAPSSLPCNWIEASSNLAAH